MSKHDTTPTPTQPSLFATDEAPDAFRKAVQVVHSMPKRPMTLVQRKIGNALLKHAISESPDKSGWWVLSLKQLEKDVSFNSNDRKLLTESAQALMSIIFEWDVVPETRLAKTTSSTRWKASVLFPEIELHSDYVRYQFSTQMKERLLKPEIYATIDMNIVRKFRRGSSLAIWEFCTRFEKVRQTPEMDLSDFRDMILGEDTGNTTYDQYKFFKSKVLKPAISEIKAEAGMTLELVETKIGKRVTKLKFLISSAKPKIVADSEIDMQAVGEMIKLGVPQSEARKLANVHSSKDVNGAIAYTKARLGETKLPKLERPAAYFRNALKNRYAGDQADTPSLPKSTAPKINIKEAFTTKRIGEAEAYFKEITMTDQTVIIERYNENQPSPLLRLSNKKSNKAATTAFFLWLASDTWGEPTPDELLAFAQSII